MPPSGTLIFPRRPQVWLLEPGLWSVNVEGKGTETKEHDQERQSPKMHSAPPGLHELWTAQWVEQSRSR